MLFYYVATRRGVTAAIKVDFFVSFRLKHVSVSVSVCVRACGCSVLSSKFWLKAALYFGVLEICVLLGMFGVFFWVFLEVLKPRAHAKKT